MLSNLELDSLLFFDIETVPVSSSYDALDEEMQELFDIKTAYQRKDGQAASEFYERAGIWAEFGKVVCISVGYFTYKNGDRQFRVKSFAGEERDLLEEFSNLVEGYFRDPSRMLCGHNIKEFDIPFVVRRMLINGVKIPNKLGMFGKKPWEVNHLDTMELWKIGDYKNFTSLKLLTRILDIPSPKDDIDGSEVAKVYYEDNNIDRIIVYCEKDVVAVAQVLLRFKREELLSFEEILSV